MMYGTLAGWRAYAAARGNAAPIEATDPVATAALQRASDYIYYHYAKKAVAVIPAEDLEAAAYEAAALELSKPGFFTKTYSPAEAKVLTEVDGIKWTVIGDGISGGGMMPTSSLIDAMLEDYIGRSVGIGFRSIGC